MSTRDLIPVTGYIRPEVKRLVDLIVQEGERPMSVSAYIALLIQRDLKGKKPSSGGMR